MGYYVCESAGDHICDQNPTSVTINSTGHCVSGREYKLTADGENGISCSMITSECMEMFMLMENRYVRKIWIDYVISFSWLCIYRLSKSFSIAPAVFFFQHSNITKYTCYAAFTKSLKNLNTVIYGLIKTLKN